MHRLTDALASAMSDLQLRKQMEAVGVDLPAPDQVTPANLSSLIERGLTIEVPALKARGEYLD